MKKNKTITVINVIIKRYDIACCWCKPVVNVELVGESLVQRNPVNTLETLLWISYNNSRI